jgi:hypothetical protein
MSEDGRAAFGVWQPPHRDTVTVLADSAATARLIEAAGWTAAVRSGAAEQSRMYAFDWRDIVPDGASLSELDSDCGVLCLVSIATIDRADALLQGRPARFVFGDAPSLITTELSDLSAFLQSGRAFDGRRDERARLQALAAELARLAEQLGSMSSPDDETDDSDRIAERNMAYSAEDPADLAPVVPPEPQRIRHLISMRRLRDRFFSAELFADPAWDIILDLAASRIEGRSVSVSSLCIAAAVPPTTALRWIRLMTDQQLLVRRADPADARRMFIGLSEPAFDQLCRWFALVDARGGMGG